jgi:hypothetical protein
MGLALLVGVPLLLAETLEECLAEGWHLLRDSWRAHRKHTP